MLPFVTTFKSVQVGASSSWQRVGWEWLWVGMLLGGGDGCLLSDVMVRAAAPAKPSVPLPQVAVPAMRWDLSFWWNLHNVWCVVWDRRCLALGRQSVFVALIVSQKSYRS